MVVGMGMFKLKELVKMKNKNEIWAEDIKAIRATFDQERKVEVNTGDDHQHKKGTRSEIPSNANTVKTMSTENVGKRKQ